MADSILQIIVNAKDNATSTLEGIGASVGNMGSSMLGMGTKLTAGVTLPIVGLGTAALLAGNQFNEGMANVISLAPQAADEIAAMGPAIQGIAVEMGKSTDDMTTGLYQVVSAFGLTGDSADVLRSNALAATAGLATTEEAIALTSAVTKAYGDTSAEAVERVADLALGTVQLGQTTFPELAASIGRVTPLTSAMGVSMEELFGVMATGTGVTGGAAEVSTQLRGIMQSLMSPTKEMTALFEELGVTTGKELIEIYGFEDGLKNVVQTVERSGEPLQKYISSIEGQTLAMVLAGTQSEVWADKTMALRESAGTAEQAFLAQTEGVNELGFAMSQAKIEVQVMAQQLGNALAPAVLAVMPLFRQVADFVKGLVQRFVEMDPAQQKLIIGLAALAAGAGPVLMVLGGLAMGLGALLSPVGLVVAGIAALVAALVGVALWLRNSEEATAVFSGAFERAKEVVAMVMAAIQTVVAAVLGAVQAFLTTHGEEIKATLTAAWQQIGRIVDLAVQLVEATIVPIFQGIAQFIREHGEEIQIVLASAWRIIQNVIQGALTLIEGIFKLALAILRGDWDEAWQVIKDTVASVWENINVILQEATTILVTIIADALTMVYDWFVKKFDEVKGFLAGIDLADVGRSIIQGLIDGVVGMGGALLDAITGIANSAINAAKRALGIKSPSAVFAEIGQDTIAGFAQGLLDGAGTTAAAMRQVMNAARDAVTPLPALQMGMAGYGSLPLNGLNGQGGQGQYRLAPAWNVQINVNGGLTNAETGRAVELGVLRAARSMGYR